MKRPGRNDPCHCGSGQKYKKCCQNRDEAPALPLPHDEYGSLVGRERIEAVVGEHRFRRIGRHGIWARPREETDHEFYVQVLRTTMSEDWNRAQLDLPVEERHVLHRWHDHWLAARRGEVEGLDRVTAGEGYTSSVTGDLMALVCLGYDLFELQDQEALPDEKLKALRHPDQFQGARYEITIAAIFVRAGYDVGWITDKSRALPEFIARHRITGTEVGVEVKSRHREGVLGRVGERPDPDSLDVDVRRLLRDALKKDKEDRPFVICLDLNLPLSSDRGFDDWIEKLHERVVSAFERGTKEDPDPWSVLAFTNFSWHWDGESIAGAAEHFLVLPQNTAHPLPNSELNALIESFAQYGDVTTRQAPNAATPNGSAVR